MKALTGTVYESSEEGDRESYEVIVYTFLLDMELERKSRCGVGRAEVRKEQYIFEGRAWAEALR